MTKFIVAIVKPVEVELSVEADSEEAAIEMVDDGTIWEKASGLEITYYGCEPWKVWRDIEKVEHFQMPNTRAKRLTSFLKALRGRRQRVEIT